MSLVVPADIIPISRRAFLRMFPWTAAVGYRRLWQGVLIRYGKTKVIPATMISRLIATTAVLFSGFFFPQISGAEIGGIALSFGVVTGAVSSHIFLKPLTKEFTDTEGQNNLSWNKLLIMILIGPFIFLVQGGIIAAAAYTFSMLIEAIFLNRKIQSTSLV